MATAKPRRGLEQGPAKNDSPEIKMIAAYEIYYMN